MELWTIVILIVASLGVGYFAAVLIGSNQRKDQTEPAAPEDRAAVPDPLEIFRLLRQENPKGVVPEINGRIVTRADDLQPEEHAELSMALVDLYAWLEKSNRPALSAEAVVAAREIAGEFQTGDSALVPAAPSAQPSPSVKPPGLNIFSSLKRTTQSEIKQKIAPPAASIAAQVDEILQSKLEEREIDGKAVRLMDLPNQGMVIMVGLEKYQDLDDVPDEELRDLIKESVSDWTSRMLGSLSAD